VPLRSDSGSAVVEFVLVFVPFALLLSLQLGYLADCLERTEVRQAAVEASHYAALADVSAAEAQHRLSDLIAGFTRVSASLAFSPSHALVTARFPSHIWLFSSIPIEVRSIAKREIDW
jgi:Flp pilus assembly protein TadG